MANFNRMGPDTWDEILQHRAYGLTAAESAEKLGVSEATINTTRSVFDAVRKRDWMAAEKLAARRLSFGIFEWASKKTGNELPPNLKTINEESRAESNIKRKLGSAQEEKTEKPAPVVIPDHWEEEKLLLGQILHELRQHNELMEQLYDVVFPKWSGDVKDNVNINCDLIGQSLKRIEDKVEAIKINARRKGM
ncbi:MAG: hypothetical protein IJV40_03615 [Oscillospiraceae bacterium]|nr:hypothetical protein [Oscillospiraceae bacterium]